MATRRITVPVSALNFGWASGFSSGFGDQAVRIRVDYALANTEPAASSGAWQFLGQRTTSGNIVSEAMRTGAVVWVRARTERHGYRPSSWTTAQAVGIGSGFDAGFSDGFALSTPVIYETMVTVAANGIPTLTWRESPNTLGLLVEYSIQAEGATASYGSSLELDAKSPGRSGWSNGFNSAFTHLSNVDREHAFMGETVNDEETMHVRVTPYNGWTDPNVTGLAGVPLYTFFTMRETVAGSGFSSGFFTGFGS